MRFLPAGETIDELKRKLADCERRAKALKRPIPAELEEEAERYRSWLVLLSNGYWTA